MLISYANEISVNPVPYVKTFLCNLMRSCLIAVCTLVAIKRQGKQIQINLSFSYLRHSQLMIERWIDENITITSQS